MQQNVVVEARYALKKGNFSATDCGGEVSVSFPFIGDVELNVPDQTFSKSDLKELIDFLTLVHTNLES